jgi:hypothetical protein
VCQVFRREWSNLDLHDRSACGPHLAWTASRVDTQSPDD